MNALQCKIVFLVLITTSTGSLLRAQDADTDASKVSKLHRSLLGAWVLVGRPGITIEPQADAEMKFWGLRHFAVTKRNDTTGEIDYHHVGTYTLDGDLYTEIITHAVGATEDLVGKSFKFRIQTDGDTYIQRGVGNPWTQEWKRLGAGKNADSKDENKETDDDPFAP
jgi:hypothetical protein